MVLLSAENINKKYANHTALKDVSISIEKGSIFGLLGPNGAGKTSLIRILNQIVYPDSGKVFFEDELLSPKHISQIGYLPEERGLYKSMKVGEQIIYLARLKGLSQIKAQEQLKFWFKRFDIEHWENKKIQELSKGMAQKIQFVVSVIHNPKLLIFDEVFSGLDPINAEIIKNEVLYLKSQGSTIIFSTHRMESVEEMCDHIALINKSEKILDGKLSEIKRNFKNDIYQVGIISENQNIKQEIEQFFCVEETSFKTINDKELQFKIQKQKDKSVNDLLSFLISKGEITHFSEIIPTANDIFIQAVTQNTK